MIRFPYAFRELRTPSRYKAFHGGRGSAKSHSCAGELVLRGAQKPLRILCAREFQKSITDSVKKLLDNKIRDYGLQNFYRSTRNTIEGRNGTEFLFYGLRTNPQSIQSVEGLNIAWVEEANTASNRSLELLTPTVRKDDSEIWFTWNRRFVTDPVDEMFLGKNGPPPRSIVRKVNWDDNPWFPDVLREEMEWCKSRDYDKYLHVWGGEPIQSSEKKVFKNWIIDDIDDQIPKEVIPLFGADWGFSVDPTVLIKCYIWNRVLYFRAEAHKVKCPIDYLPALFAGTDDREPKRWPNPKNYPGIEGALDHPIVADSARPETIDYLRKRGFTMKGAKKGPGSVMDGIEFMNSYDIVVHPDCKHVIDELGTYSFKEDPHTGEILPQLEDKHNHTIDACRYATEGHRRVRAISIAAPQTVPLKG